MVLHIQNFMDIQAMMMVSLPVPSMPIPYVPTVESADFGKTKRTGTIRIFQESIHLCP